MLQCCKYRGTVSLVGLWVNEAGSRWKDTVPADAQSLREARDGTSFHITVITATELDAETEAKIEPFLADQGITAVVLGTSLVMKGPKQAWYAAVYCPWADSLRTRAGLAPKEFHITLGFIGGDLYGQPSIYQTMRWRTERHHWMEVATTVLKSTASLKAPSKLERMLMRRACDHIGATNTLDPEQIRCLRDIAICSMSFDRVLAADIGYLLLGKGLPMGLQILLQSRPELNSLDELSSLLPVACAGARDGKAEPKLAVIRDCNNTLFDRAGARAGKKPYARLHVFGVDGGALQLLILQRNFSWVTLAADARLAGLIGNANRRCLPYMLAGSAVPTEPMHLRAMAAVGIRHIVTVHENHLSPQLCPTLTVGAGNGTVETTNVAPGEVVSYHFHVADRTPPSAAQLRTMCQLLDSALPRGEGVLVHCQGGVGRTNTVIIAYLMWALDLSAAEATAQVTAQRSIILSQSQKGALQRWWAECNERRNNALSSSGVAAPPVAAQTVASSTVPTHIPTDLVQSPRLSGSTYRKTAAALNMPPLIVLCGYPCSGKSTFAKALASHTDYFVRINKDEMRAKNQCEDTLFDAMNAISKGKIGGRRAATKATEPGSSVKVSPHAGAVVIDCCNLTKAKRKEWLQLAHHPRAWCVYFGLDIEQCRVRMMTRTNHPTIHSFVAGERILNSMKNLLEPPTKATHAEEGFERLFVVSSGEECNALLRAWKVPEPTQVDAQAQPDPDPAEGEAEDDNGEGREEPGIAWEAGESDQLLKFPRTSHIMNLGAATRDDKVLGPTDIAALVGPGRHIIVEEKLDGANMGISINKEENKIVVQNRSHFISSKYHAQFAPLDHWLAQHSAELWSILTPGRHVLYGEWLYATHSVKYTHLPGWFLAYDLYDRVTQTFASREVLAEVLVGTTIPLVPLVFVGTVESVEKLKALVDGGSAFNDARREGVVVRVCEGGRLLSRAKLVRSDFIAGNDRWNKSSKLETNSLAPGAT